MRVFLYGGGRDSEKDGRLSDDLLETVDRCLEGDQYAMVRLVERFEGVVFGLCLRMLRHRQDAEDVAQEVMVRMLRGLGGWDRTRDFTPWLLAIAGNRCRTALSRRKLVVEPLVDEPTDRSANLASANLFEEELERALATLREEYRLAFLLCHQHQLSYSEIAESLDCPEGTVKTWVYRARRSLAKELLRRGVIEPNAVEANAIEANTIAPNNVASNAAEPDAVKPGSRVAEPVTW